MAIGTTGFSDKSICSPSPRETWNYKWIYFCPGHIRTSKHSNQCGGVGDMYCKDWSCVSTGAIYWDSPWKNDYISIKRNTTFSFSSKDCDNWQCCGKRKNPLILQFTATGRAAPQAAWLTGLRWGGRRRDREGDKGNIFTVQLSITPETSQPIGQNKVPVYNPLLIPSKPTDNPLFKLLTSSFLMLNSSRSNLTSSCWLCLTASPPFYEATGSVQSFTNSTVDSSCRWRNGTQTISGLSGQGCCLGNIPTNLTVFCSNASSCSPYMSYHSSGTLFQGFTSLWSPYPQANFSNKFGNNFFIPGNDSVWACSTGLTACVHGPTLLSQSAYCIQVYILPKITYHATPEMVTLYEPTHNIKKREVVTALTLSVLLGLGAAGAATGVAAIVTNNQQFHSLRASIDEDLERIETSITHLQKSLTSLSEVVLQNRRGLDLLFLKEGGLCVALHEECCFYADHSGIVLDSMKELKIRLLDRKKERELRQNWYEGWFNISPWFTTLISALAGPLIILLLICTIGPCVLGKIVQFLKTRISALDTEVSKNAKALAILHANSDKLPLLHFSDDISSEDEADTNGADTGSLGSKDNWQPATAPSNMDVKAPCFQLQ